MATQLVTGSNRFGMSPGPLETGGSIRLLSLYLTQAVGGRVTQLRSAHSRKCDENDVRSETHD